MAAISSREICSVNSVPSASKIFRLDVTQDLQHGVSTKSAESAEEFSTHGFRPRWWRPARPRAHPSGPTRVSRLPVPAS
jgi:hypothetical protein